MDDQKLNEQPKLTSAEIASLWTSYLNNSMSTCILSYFLKDVEDPQIKEVVQYSYDIALFNLEGVKGIFQSEQIPIPTGFTKDDVNLNASRLYTDLFMLMYVENMGKAGLLAYGGMVAMSARKDVRLFFGETLQKTYKLFDLTLDVSALKGLLVRAPYIPYPTQTDQVDTHKYLSGFSLFSKKRPLNAIEISYLHQNIQTNVLGTKLALSFAQASPREEIQKFMLRGSDISEKHIKIFTGVLLDNDMQPPISSDTSITDSTTAPFSDKLMLFHMGMLSAIGVGNYATAAAASQRSDLALNYERLSIEIGQYAKDGADIMINNAWLEQPPTTKDKHSLARDKGHNK